MRPWTSEKLSSPLPFLSAFLNCFFRYLCRRIKDKIDKLHIFSKDFLQLLHGVVGSRLLTQGLEGVHDVGQGVYPEVPGLRVPCHQVQGKAFLHIKRKWQNKIYFSSGKTEITGYNALSNRLNHFESRIFTTMVAKVCW